MDRASPRPIRGRAAVLLTTVPIAVAVGAVVASPFGALGPSRPADGTDRLSAGAGIFDKCEGARAGVDAGVTVSAVGALKWPACAGD